MFMCDGKDCTQTIDPVTLKIMTQCPGAKCDMTCEVDGPDKACSKFIATQVRKIGTKGPVRYVRM